MAFIAILKCCCAQVVNVQFDRKDIRKNKLLVTTLESKFHVYDVRTLHPEAGFAHLSQNVSFMQTTCLRAQDVQQQRSFLENWSSMFNPMDKALTTCVTPNNYCSLLDFATPMFHFWKSETTQFLHLTLTPLTSHQCYVRVGVYFFHTNSLITTL